MPSINNNNGNSTTAPNAISFCEVRQNWDDDWVFVPWLIPMRLIDPVSPNVGEAQLQYELGTIKAQGDFAFDVYTPLSIQDYYVRISTQYPDNDPVPLWIGVITEDHTLFDRNTSASGVQTFTCRSLAHLLDRETVSNAFALELDFSDPVELDWVPKFNERHTTGGSLLGNASDYMDVDNAENQESEIRVFQRDGELWSYYDIIIYLLEYFGPGRVPFQLSGQYEPLEEIFTVFDARGKSCWQCLTELINRTRGLGFRVVVGDDNVVYLDVFTHTDTTISIGSNVLPANANQVPFNAPSDFPLFHMVGDCPFQKTAVKQYDVVKVLGNRIKLTMNWTYQDATLDTGWSSDLETDYESASTTSDSDANDLYRADEKFDDVWRTLIVPKGWDWRVQDGLGAGPFFNVAPYVYNDGTYQYGDDSSDPASKQGRFWNAQKRFLRNTNFECGKDYSVSPIVDNNPDATETQFVKMLAFIKDTTDGVHSKDDKWHQLDNLRAVNPQLKDISITPLDHEMGIQLGCKPNHYMAANHFDSAEPTNEEPELDYTWLGVCATVECDVCQQIVVSNFAGNPDDSDRTLTLNVKHAELQIVVKDTIIGVDSMGDLKRIHDDNLVIRDDVELLKQIAAMSVVHYMQKRQTVSIPIHSIGLFVPLGSLLSSVNTIYASEPVRTVVTQREIDFDTQTTTISTGHAELDLVAFANKFEDAEG